MLSISRQTTNQILKDLKPASWCACSGEVEIMDLAGLRRTYA